MNNDVFILFRDIAPAPFCGLLFFSLVGMQALREGGGFVFGRQVGSGEAFADTIDA
jgi:hypothetical protein